MWTTAFLLIAPLPAPPVVAPRAPAMVYTTPVFNDPSRSDMAVPDRLDVHVTGGGETLFRGPLRISRQTSASFSQSKSDASDRGCTSGRYGSEGRSAVNLSLRQSRTGDDQTSYLAEVSWTRPVTTEGCDGNASRTVSLSQSFKLAVGQTLTIEGDGGLRLIITRRS
jgi:hypothetical protein